MHKHVPHTMVFQCILQPLTAMFSSRTVLRQTPQALSIANWSMGLAITC